MTIRVYSYGWSHSHVDTRNLDNQSAVLISFWCFKKNSKNKARSQEVATGNFPTPRPLKERF